MSTEINSHSCLPLTHGVWAKEMEVEVKQEEIDSLVRVPTSASNREGELGEPIVVDDIGELELFPDVEYSDQKGQIAQNISNNSSEEYAKKGEDLTQQQKFVEQKYQKYKKLRRKLQEQRENLPENRSVSDSFSSFSGSSISSSSSSDQGEEGISKQNMEMIIRKFQKMQQPRTNMSQEPITIRRIANEHNVDFEQLQAIFERWKKNSLANARREERIAKQSQATSEKGSQKVTLVPTESQLNIDRLKFIEGLITENPFITQSQIYLQLNKMNHLKSIKHGKFKEISRAIVTTLLTEGPFKQTRLRVLPANRNSERVVGMRYMFCREFWKKVNKGYQIFFLDEHNFELFQEGDCMWVRPDQISKPALSCKKHQFSLLALFDLLGGAYWKVSSNCREKYDDVLGFHSLFLQSLEVQEKKYQTLSRGEDWDEKVEHKVCLVLDHQVIKNRQTIELYKQKFNAKILFLPHCSVQLNPIESWFQQLRSEIRANTYKSNEELLNGVHRLLKEYQSHNFEPIVNESLNQISRGYRRALF